MKCFVMFELGIGSKKDVFIVIDFFIVLFTRKLEKKRKKSKFKAISAHLKELKLYEINFREFKVEIH